MAPKGLLYIYIMFYQFDTVIELDDGKILTGKPDQFDGNFLPIGFRCRFSQQNQPSLTLVTGGPKLSPGCWAVRCWGRLPLVLGRWLGSAGAIAGVSRGTPVLATGKRGKNNGTEWDVAMVKHIKS